LIDRAVATIEDRFTARVLRTLTTLRKRLDASNLAQVIEQTYGSTSKRKLLARDHSVANIYTDANTKSQLESYIHGLPTKIDDAMQVDSTAQPAEATQDAEKDKSYEPTPESDVYVRLLVVLALLDADKLDQVS
jgi:26S proteasome regulatory subunit N3